MYLIIDRGKIASYVILLSTVIILFGLALNLKNESAIPTTANILKYDNINSIVSNEISK